MRYSTTKASRVTDRILVAIETGEYQPGASLPLRSELAREFGTTVNRALWPLRKAGLIACDWTSGHLWVRRWRTPEIPAGADPSTIGVCVTPRLVGEMHAAAQQHRDPLIVWGRQPQGAGRASSDHPPLGLVLELGHPTNPAPGFWLITCSDLDRALRLRGLPLQERLNTESAAQISAELSIIATSRLRRAGHTHPPAITPRSAEQSAGQDAGQATGQGMGPGGGQVVQR